MMVSSVKTLKLFPLSHHKDGRWVQICVCGGEGLCDRVWVQMGHKVVNGRYFAQNADWDSAP